LNYKNTRTHAIVVLRVTKHFTCAVAARNALEPAVDKDRQAQRMGITSREPGTVRGTAKRPHRYLRNRSTLDIGVLGYIGIF